MITKRDPEELKPETRRRRGGGEGRLLAMRIRLLHATKPAARGRYERLAIRHFPPEDEFASAARSLCNAIKAFQEMFADLNERLAEALYGHTASLGMEAPSHQSGSFNLSLCNPFGSLEDAWGDHGLEGFDAPDTGAALISLGL